MMGLPALILWTFTACQEYGIVDDRPAIVADASSEELTPDIVVEPALLDFGVRSPSCEPASQIVTVTNTGTAPLDVRTLFFDGVDADAYGIDTLELKLEPGESGDVTVWFAPSEWRAYQDVTLILLSDDPDEGRVDVPIAGTGADQLELSESFEQVQPNPVDVLFVIDNSGSMEDEVAELSSAFGTFIDAFTNLGLDYHIAVTTTDTDDASQAGRFRGPPITVQTPDPLAEFALQSDLGTDGSGEERGFDAALAALSPPMIDGANAGFLREEANLAIVVVSDEDDSSFWSASTFSVWLDAMKDDPSQSSFSALVGPDSASYYASFACDLLGGRRATTAPRYHDAIEYTGGVSADICENEIDPFLEHLSWVSAGLLDTFELGAVPSDLANVTVTVDGVDIAWGADHGWKWDPTSQSVVLHGDAVPAPGGTVLVDYVAETSCSP